MVWTKGGGGGGKGGNRGRGGGKPRGGGPSGPRFSRAKKARGRSGSPSRGVQITTMRDREDDRDGNEWEDEVEEDYSNTPFADPYTMLDRGTEASEAFDSKHYPRVEFTWEDKGWRATELGTAIQDLVEVARRHQIDPRDFPAATIEQLNGAELKNVLRCLNVCCAHAHGRKYRQEYTQRGYMRTAKERIDEAKIGQICSGPFRTPMSDKQVGIDDLQRSNGTQGSTSNKRRFWVNVDKDGGDIERAFVTGFGDNEVPPPSRMHQYLYLTHQDTKDQVPKVNLPVVKFVGEEALSKLSYLDYVHREWTSLADLPYRIHGYVVSDYFEPLAKIMRQDKHTGLRKELDRVNRETMKAGRQDEAAWKRRAERGGRPHGLLDPETDEEKISSLEAENARLKAQLGEEEKTRKGLQMQLAEKERRGRANVPSPPTSTPNSTPEKPQQQIDEEGAQGGQVGGGGGEASVAAAEGAGERGSRGNDGNLDHVGEQE